MSLSLRMSLQFVDFYRMLFMNEVHSSVQLRQEKHLFFLSELLDALGKLLWIIISLTWKVDSFKVAIYFVNPYE